MSEALQKSLMAWKPGLLRCPDGHKHQMVSDIATARDICTRCGMVQAWLSVSHE